MKVLVLSPHRDDAAFSCAITMMALAQLGAEVTIVNLFTLSDYAPFSSSTGCERISELRCLEDAEFLRQPGLAATMLDLDMEDAPLRLALPTDQVLGDCLSEDGFEEQISIVGSRLGLLVGALRQFDAILMPLAVGNHIDHRITRAAAQRVWQGGAMAFYEDLPYACHTTPETMESHVNELMASMNAQLCAHRINVAGGSELKRRCALVYKSQIAPEVADAISGYAASMQNGERVWATREWLAAMPSSAFEKPTEGSR